jgi:tRNA threonylcarbamoyladenosine biosynthesis protein TsaB
MMILAIEFSSPRRSVALSRDGSTLAETVAQTEGRGTDAFGLIEQALRKAEVSREAVEAIAIGLGPGSYTGIRAAIAVAQGWQLARGVKLLGVSSMESLALQAQIEGMTGLVDLVVDAQRGEFYLARWEISRAARREIVPLKIIPRSELAGQKDVIRVGPEIDRKLYPTATAVAQLASERTDFISGEKLEPIYLRETTFVKTSPPNQISRPQAMSETGARCFPSNDHNFTWVFPS